MQPGFSIEGNRIIFAETLKEINRGHNVDERPLYEADENDEVTTSDDLAPDAPSCPDGVTNRLLQSEYGHPYLCLPESRELNLEILRARMEDLLIKNKGSASDSDAIFDKLDRLPLRILNHLYQDLDQRLELYETEEDEKIELSDIEKNKLNKALTISLTELKKFINDSVLWFGEIRMKTHHAKPIPSNITAPTFYKNHFSYSEFINYCSQHLLDVFALAFWQKLKKLIEVKSRPKGYYILSKRKHEEMKSLVSSGSSNKEINSKKHCLRL